MKRMMVTVHFSILSVNRPVVLFTLSTLLAWGCYEVEGAVECVSDGDCSPRETCIIGVCVPDSDSDVDSDTDSDADTDTDLDTDTGVVSAFVSVWDTRDGGSKNASVSLPLVKNGRYDFLVQWGDGTMDRIDHWKDLSKRHYYAEPGVYMVTITGTISGWAFKKGYNSARTLNEIVSWGPLGFGNTSHQFNGCSNLEISATDAPNLTETTSLERAFFNCSKLTSISSIGRWDTSNVTDMTEMFGNAINFNGDLSGWDTSNVTNMTEMFANAINFNGDLSGWDTSRVTTMSEMFVNAYAFDGDISGWDTSNVIDMSGMFTCWTPGPFHCHLIFNQDISRWDTSKVKYMGRMFLNAELFDQDLSNWEISNVRQMQGLFVNAALSTANYDALLIAWADQDVQEGVTFHGGNAKYSPGAAADARKKLIEDHNWEIEDGGLARLYQSKRLSPIASAAP